MLLGRFDDTTGDGTVDRLIIEWNNVQGASTSPSTVTFQAILQLNTGAVPGTITFNYPDLNAGNFRSNGGSATVGIKAAGAQGGNRLLIARNNAASPYVGSGKAIRIMYEGAAAAARSEPTLLSSLLVDHVFSTSADYSPTGQRKTWRYWG
jgi:hypothetical protein